LVLSAGGMPKNQDQVNEERTYEWFDVTNSETRNAE
jgi:hypothetical protein